MTEHNPLVVVEHRYTGVKVEGVDFAQRLITVIAVPYEQPAPVEYRSEMWNEVFERGAFSSVTSGAPHRVRVNRDHNKTRTVGKVVKFWPDREDGLITDVRIAKTPLGDETLALADEDMLSASVGFGVRPTDQVLDRRSMTRRIKAAYLDHLSFVESPAYAGAQVLAVRSSDAGEAARLDPLRTPLLDQFTDDPIMRWASERLRQQ
ncbi:capsid maturation protease [Mycobacterium phage MooMoo]|uniref:Capsid maturation protease n=1 Tax=Mycobacterium phage MooMoo TaxID=2108127 RepID=A0A2P1JR53_9CAUD|nr:capsid maturation protease [Mycobacterium phage MooMoo]AVO21610.1 capsid maturation protease [Mycobacterium phage MooMoo]